MRRLASLLSVAAASVLAAAVPTSSAQAALILVGTFSGNQCGGAGGFSVCYASGTTAGTGAVLKTPGGSPSIIRVPSDGAREVSTNFPTVSGSEFVVNYAGATNTLTFNYNAGAGDPVAHYIGLFQAGTYDLFYDPNPITSGSIALSTYFPNNPGFSHIDFFDTGAGAVPEPATWAMMLIGFGAAGMSLRRRKRVALQAA